MCEAPSPHFARVIRLAAVERGDCCGAERAGEHLLFAINNLEGGVQHVHVTEALEHKVK